MARPCSSAACLLLLLAGAGCWDTHAPVPDAAPVIDPGRTDPNDPVPGCGAACEDHFGAICLSATQGLCTCDPRGMSGKGKWDCAADWSARTAACAAGEDHGAACPRVLSAIEQVCAGPASDQPCYCSASLTWRCMVVPR